MDEENNGNSLGTKLKDKINSAIKKITKIITKFLLVKALPIVIIIILLAGAWYVITGGVVDKIKEVFTGTVGGDILHNINIDMIDNDERVYVIQDDYSEEIKAALKEIDVDYTTIGLGEDLNIIKKFYEAEIVTSCPDLRLRDEIGTEVEDGNLQGIIQFKRKYSDSTEELLEYKDFTSFQTELAKFGYDLQDAEGNSSTQEQIYFTRSDVESNYEELKRYFTLDSEMNLIIATINSTYIDNRYSDYAKKEGNQDSQDYSFYIGIKKVNYRTVTDKYSMPMEFLLYMLMISQNPGFCEEIVELVKESKIVIEIQDNITTTTTTESYDYRADFILTGSARVYIHVDKTKYPYYGGANYTYVNISKDPKEEIAKKQKDIVNHPYSVKKTIEQSNNISLYVTEAKTWIMDYEAIYSNMQEEETMRDQITYPDDNYIGVEDFHGYLNEYLTDKTDILGQDDLKGVAKDQFDIVSTSGNITERKTGKQTIIETQVVRNKYVINSTIVEGKEEKFLSLLKVDPTTGIFDKQNRNKNTEYKKYKNTEGIEESPEGNILSATDALFYFLSSKESTQSYESIMRYLLYIYTGTNYGVTTFDFSIYEPSQFAQIGLSAGTSQFKEYLHAWEGCTSLTADGTAYIIEKDGGGNLTVGYGVDINANADIITAAGYSTSEGASIPKEFVDSLEDQIISNCIQAVQNNTAGLNLTQYQIYALASRVYNCGSSGAFSVRNGKSFTQAYNEYWNQERDSEYRAIPNDQMYSHSLYTQYMQEPITSNGEVLEGLVNRRKSEWILFKTGYFDRIDEYCSGSIINDTAEFGSSSGTIAGILESADIIFQYMYNNNYKYSLNVNKLASTYEASKNEMYKSTCCATYVSWVLRSAGCINNTWHSSSQMYSNLKNNLNFIEVSYSNIEAGDIVFMDTQGTGSINHVQLYAGDGRWYNAGSQSRINQAQPYKSGNVQSKVKKILRYVK